MEKIVDFMEYVDDSDWGCEDCTNLPNPEEIIEDTQALNYIGEDAFHILVEGFNHRKRAIRLRSAMLLADMFPAKESFELFKSALLDRKEWVQLRFHLARNLRKVGRDGLDEIAAELESSKGCNDRIVAAILFGDSLKSESVFRLLKLLNDTNDCVKIAAFLSLMKNSSSVLLESLIDFVRQATARQLMILQNNLSYYDDCAHYPLVAEQLQKKRQLVNSSKILFHPTYYEQSYDQEKPSKLDRHPLCIPQDEDEVLCFFEV
jgi:hypothetical protein